MEKVPLNAAEIVDHLNKHPGPWLWTFRTGEGRLERATVLRGCASVGDDGLINFGDDYDSFGWRDHDENFTARKVFIGERLVRLEYRYMHERFIQRFEPFNE